MGVGYMVDNSFSNFFLVLIQKFLKTFIFFCLKLNCRLVIPGGIISNVLS
jgi:hypothetical protein